MQSAPIPPPTGQVGNYSRPQVDLRALAKAQRDLLRYFLINVGVYVLTQILVNGLHLGFALPVGVLVLLAFGVLQVVAAYQIAVALKTGAPALFAAGMFVPCVSLVVLLVLNGKATKVLQSAGIPVGFMGVSQADFDALPG